MISLERKALCALQAIQEKVNEQANDEGLWSIALNRTIMEAYLQQELRALHDVIERFTIPMFEKELLRVVPMEEANENH